MFVCWLLSWYVFGMLTPQLCIRDALWQAAATTAAIATLCTCNCSTLWSLFAYRYAATCTACSGGATSYGCCDYFGHDTVTNDHLSQCHAQNSRGQCNLPQSIQLAAVNSTCRHSGKLNSILQMMSSWTHHLQNRTQLANVVAAIATPVAAQSPCNCTCSNFANVQS